MSILDIKPDASIIEWLLRIRCPRVKEPDYTSLPQMLHVLIQTSRLTHEEVASKLCISMPILDKLPARSRVPSVETLELAMELAQQCCLPKMAAHLRILRTATAKRTPTRPRLYDQDQK